MINMSRVNKGHGIILQNKVIIFNEIHLLPKGVEQITGKG